MQPSVRENNPMLGSSSVFDMPQAQLSMWGCDYILSENERRFQVYCSGCRGHPDAFQSEVDKHSSLFCSLAVLDPRVGHTMNVLSPFIPVLCHSDWLSHGESCPRLDVVIQAVRGLPRLRAPGIVPCIISFSRQLPCFLMVWPWYARLLALTVSSSSPLLQLY